MLPLFALAACIPEEPGSSVRSAEPAACLQPPPGAAPTEVDGDLVTFAVEGVATADQAAEGEAFDHGVRCERVVRVVTITDDSGGDWRIGYGWSEGNQDETPQIDLQPMAPVTFTFRDLETPLDGGSIGEASGFVLREGGRVSAVIDVGAYGPALNGDDLDVLVGEGEVTGTAPGGECGRKIGRALRFEAETEAMVEAVGFDTVNVEGQTVTVWALASWGWEDPVCPDVAGELSWAVWREP